MVVLRPSADGAVVAPLRVRPEARAIWQQHTSGVISDLLRSDSNLPSIHDFASRAQTHRSVRTPAIEVTRAASDVVRLSPLRVTQPARNSKERNTTVSAADRLLSAPAALTTATATDTPDNPSHAPSSAERRRRILSLISDLRGQLPMCARSASDLRKLPATSAAAAADHLPKSQSFVVDVGCGRRGARPTRCRSHQSLAPSNGGCQTKSAPKGPPPARCRSFQSLAPSSGGGPTNSASIVPSPARCRSFQSLAPSGDCHSAPDKKYDKKQGGVNNNQVDYVTLNRSNIARRSRSVSSSRSRHPDKSERTVHTAAVKGSQQDLPVKHNPGVVPRYLTRRRAAWQREEEQRHAEQLQPPCPPGYTCMPDSERLHTLRLLEKNLKMLESELSRLPLPGVVDEHSRLLRHRRHLEEQMKKLEHGVSVFSRARVFVRTAESQQV